MNSVRMKASRVFELLSVRSVWLNIEWVSFFHAPAVPHGLDQQIHFFQVPCRASCHVSPGPRRRFVGGGKVPTTTQDSRLRLRVGRHDARSTRKTDIPPATGENPSEHCGLEVTVYAPRKFWRSASIVRQARGQLMDALISTGGIQSPPFV